MRRPGAAAARYEQRGLARAPVVIGVAVGKSKQKQKRWEGRQQATGTKINREQIARKAIHFPGPWVRLFFPLHLPACEKAKRVLFRADCSVLTPPVISMFRSTSIWGNLRSVAEYEIRTGRRSTISRTVIAPEISHFDFAKTPRFFRCYLLLFGAK